MVNFGLLAAEINPVVWGTPANFNSFRVLAVLLHGSQVVNVSQTAVLNRGRHLCSTGRPSRWALAHVLVKMTSTTQLNMCRGVQICCHSDHNHRPTLSVHSRLKCFLMSLVVSIVNWPWCLLAFWWVVLRLLLRQFYGRYIG